MTSILKIKSPVPSDIEIAQSVTPLHISLIAEALGLEAGEIDLYGAHKAKVRRLSQYALPCFGRDGRRHLYIIVLYAWPLEYQALQLSS